MTYEKKLCKRKEIRETMGEIKNVAAPAKDEQVNINRAAIEHRATWVGPIYGEFEKAGIDPGPIFRKVTHKCGNIRDENFKTARFDPEDCRDLIKVFLNNLGRKTSEQEMHQATETEVPVDFHYYALLNAWKKLGFDGEAYAVLCDIAVNEDRGIVEAMGLDLELTDALVKGCPTCRFCFHK